jgi:hypothetical protein
MHELSESTKRLLDYGSLALTGLAGATRAVTLSEAALIVTIAAGLLSAAWQLVRFYDRIKYGRAAD